MPPIGAGFPFQRALAEPSNIETSSEPGRMPCWERQDTIRRRADADLDRQDAIRRRHDASLEIQGAIRTREDAKLETKGTIRTRADADLAAQFVS